MCKVYKLSILSIGMRATRNKDNFWKEPHTPFLVRIRKINHLQTLFRNFFIG